MSMTPDARQRLDRLNQILTPLHALYDRAQSLIRVKAPPRGVAAGGELEDVFLAVDALEQAVVFASRAKRRIGGERLESRLGRIISVDEDELVEVARALVGEIFVGAEPSQFVATHLAPAFSYVMLPHR